MGRKFPIGVFDSGIGGLTVAKAICDRLPLEEIVYFGDTAHLPYGDKSHTLIKSFSRNITKYLVEEIGCKAIVIACNTASAASYEYLRDIYKGSTPIINVIDPIIEAIVKDDSIQHIGIIATHSTINSGVYQEKLRRRKPNAKVSSLATPLLVPMIEEGYANDSISHAVLEKYLSNEQFKDIDALILGCTHYVLVKNEINLYFNHKVKLFDSTHILADNLASILEKEGLLKRKKDKENIFIVSDLTEDFEKSANRFFNKNVTLQLQNI